MSETTTTTPTGAPAAPPAAAPAASTPSPVTTLIGSGSPAPAAGSPPAGSQPAPSAPPAAQSAAESEFGLNPEQRGFFENKAWVKDGKLDVKKLADGYIQLEKFRGAPEDEIFKISKTATPEELARLNKRLGVPEDPKGYTLKLPDGANQEAVAKIQAMAHKAGLTQGQLQSFFEYTTNEIQAQQTQQAAAEDAALKSGLAELTKDWGQALQKNKTIAHGASKLDAFVSEGMDEGFWAHAAKYPGMNPAKVARALYKLGTGLGEDKFIDGQPISGGARSPESAQARLDEIERSPALRKALLSGSDPVLAAEFEQLNVALISGQKR